MASHLPTFRTPNPNRLSSAPWIKSPLTRARPHRALKRIIRPPILRENFKSDEDVLRGVEAPHPPAPVEIIFDFAFSALISKSIDAFRKVDENHNSFEASAVVYMHFHPLFLQWIFTVCWANSFKNEGDLVSTLWAMLSMAIVAVFNMEFPACIQGFHPCLPFNTSCLPESVTCFGEFLALALLRLLMVFAYARSAWFSKPPYHTHWKFQDFEARAICIRYIRYFAFFSSVYFVIAGLARAHVRISRSLYFTVTILEYFLWLLGLGGKRQFEILRPHVGYVTARFNRLITLSMATLIPAVLFSGNGNFTSPPEMFGLVIASPFILLPLQILYFDIQSCRPRHALTVSQGRGRVWMSVHGLVVSSLGLLSASLFTFQSSIKNGEEWESRPIFGVSVAVYSFACFGLQRLHIGRGKGSRLFPMWLRLVVRLVTGGTVYILSLIPDSTLPSGAFLLIACVMVLLDAIWETVAYLQLSEPHAPNPAGDDECAAEVSSSMKRRVTLASQTTVVGPEGYNFHELSVTNPQLKLPANDIDSSVPTPTAPLIVPANSTAAGSVGYWPSVNSTALSSIYDHWNFDDGVDIAEQ